MKSPKTFLTYSPFQDLKGLLKAKSISLPEHPKIEAAKPESEESSDFEEKLFSEAMEGVIPIARDNCLGRNFRAREGEIRLAEGSEQEEEAEALAKLSDLVKYGTGFNIFDTAEYIEGTGYNIHPEVARRLHRGDFSIQAHVDLHALNANNARAVFEKFLKWAVITGKRGVLIIHGRGLSSPSGPVLKAKIIEWLTRGPWRKWIIAYASARSCDGGAGATYVLLRQRPVSKRGKIGPGKLKRRVRPPC